MHWGTKTTMWIELACSGHAEPVLRSVLGAMQAPLAANVIAK